MKNIDKVRAMSVEELAGEIAGLSCEMCFYQRNGHECRTNRCENGIAKWLNQESNPMPEIKVGDILISTTPSEYYIAGASNKLLAARSLMVLDLDKVLRHDQIACIKRWNGTDVETIWRYDTQSGKKVEKK